MRRITDILSKEVVSVAEGEIIGIVTNGYTDGKLSRVRGFKVSGEDSDEPRALPLRRLLGEGDALTVTGSSALRSFSDRECPLGVKVFDTAGRSLGVLRDLLYDERDGAVTALAIGEEELSPASVIRFGKSALLLCAPLHEGKVFRRHTGGGAIHPEGRQRKEAKPHPLPAVPAKAASPAPIAVVSDSAARQDYAFLLGRRIERTIGSEKEPIAKAGDTVTTTILQKARERGKLVELTVNSRRG